jgi:protein SCO1/2
MAPSLANVRHATATAARALAPALSFALSLVVLGGPVACSKSPAGGSSSAETQPYKTRGTVKSFGGDRKSVKIAHEDVPGYMKAMTMSFAVASPNELDGLHEGDAVDFSFTEQSDGRLLIQTIKKR